MAFCTGCGHQLGGVGRFCTNCGRPIPTGDPTAAPTTPTTPTAPAPAAPTGAPPSAPPPAYEPPPAPRYPLYADDPAPVTALAGPPPGAPPAPDPAQGPVRRSGPSFLVIALIVVVLVLVALIGALLMFSGGDDDGDRADDPAPGGSASVEESAPPSEAGTPDAPPTTPPPSGGSQDIARYATVSAPRTAKPGLDTRGNVVRYDARNMVDGVPSTCWRTGGDGTGLEITFTFDDPVELTEVGLINGYAKRDGPRDWYQGNRKILAVEWQFEDGTTVEQRLSENRDPQTVEVDPVTTSTVVLRLTEVSPPGRGPARRDYTPISDVTLIGSAA